jgi:glycosyltransferase involved in cell wall biosynthesis
MRSPSIVLFVVPSIRIGGGTLEIIRLAEELRSRGTDARVLSLWKHPNPAPKIDVPIVYLSPHAPSKLRAVFDLMVLMPRYWRYLRKLQDQVKSKNITAVLTHYATFPFGSFTSPTQRYCFVQDLEWMFLSKGPHRWVLRKFILHTYAQSQVVTANTYLHKIICSIGIVPVAEASIWAAPSFSVDLLNDNRPVDVVMVLRHGHHKRLDLYMQLLAAAKELLCFSCAVITTEDNIAIKASKFTDICLLRPNSEEMKSLFQRSKVFVLLSEHEGFGLPPLEAMGAGCVPLCRDAGGVCCYMTGALAENLIPLDAPLDPILQRINTLLADREKLQRLSSESRRIFVDGAKESREKRKKSLTLLSFT